MVKKCSRLQYLRFLLTLSSTGLAAGEHGFFTVVPAVAVHVEPVGARESRWNADGELLPSNHITGAGWGGAACGPVGLAGGRVVGGGGVCVCGWWVGARGYASAKVVMLRIVSLVAPDPLTRRTVLVRAAEVHRGVIEVFARGVEV